MHHLFCRWHWNGIDRVPGGCSPSHACLRLRTHDDVEQFYKGKSIRVVIGHSAGGGYDLYARLLSKHLRKHIPGQPTIVPQTMTGAGGLRVTNYLYSRRPRTAP